VDGLAQTVRNLKYKPILLDGLKLSRKNRLDLFLDVFFFDFWTVFVISQIFIILIIKKKSYNLLCKLSSSIFSSSFIHVLPEYTDPQRDERDQRGRETERETEQKRDEEGREAMSIDPGVRFRWPEPKSGEAVRFRWSPGRFPADRGGPESGRRSDFGGRRS
jgi:hypothetical protein